jgi:hypothetical protein
MSGKKDFNHLSIEKERPRYTLLDANQGPSPGTRKGGEKGFSFCSFPSIINPQINLRGPLQLKQYPLHRLFWRHNRQATWSDCCMRPSIAIPPIQSDTIRNTMAVT